MQIENIYNTLYKDTEIRYTHLNMLVQPLVPTCVISRRAKKKTNTDMRLCQMKISDGTASFMPPSSEKKIFKNQCTHLAKLYKDIDNKIVFSQETNEVAFELVMWDSELQGRNPRILPQPPRICIGAFPADRPSQVDHNTQGSIYMCEKGVIHKSGKQDDEYFTLPDTSLYNSDLFGLIGSTGTQKVQLAICKRDGKIEFYINGAMVSKVFEPEGKHFLALSVTDRRLCSLVMRTGSGTVVHSGNLWDVTELSDHKRAHYRDRDGTPYTHGAETVTNDIAGAHYEAAVHREYFRIAADQQQPWLVPKFYGILSDDEGPVLNVEHVKGDIARQVRYDSVWIITGVLTDVVSCANIMHKTRIVHEDFYLRNFMVYIDRNKQIAQGTMIDFDRVRCLYGESEQTVSRWTVSVVLALLMELAYIVFNVSESVDPTVAHTLLRTIDIFAEDQPIYFFRSRKFVPNWKYWCVWYEGEHECNDAFYFKTLHGTNLKYRIRDNAEGRTIDYTTAMKCALRFLSYQLYLFTSENRFMPTTFC